MHVQNAKTWKYVWYSIGESINKKLQNKMKIVHEEIKKKYFSKSQATMQQKRTKITLE
jgi:hypothetical protein